MAALGQRVRRRIALLLLVAAPLPAAGAESAAWAPPPVGLTTVYRAWIGQESLEVSQRVVAANGDQVVLESLPAEGQPRERYFRFLLSQESQGVVYSFDTEAVAALWPLETGKRAATKVMAVLQGRPITFDWAAEVDRFEDLATAAGTFRAVRVVHTLDAPGLVKLETQTWLAVEQGFPVRTETSVTLAGGQPEIIVLELLELR